VSERNEWIFEIMKIKEEKKKLIALSATLSGIYGISLFPLFVSF